RAAVAGSGTLHPHVARRGRRPRPGRLRSWPRGHFLLRQIIDMQTLLTFIGSILNSVRSVVGLVLPIFADAADFRNWPGWLKALVGLAILGGLCVGAFYLQRAVDLGDLLKHIPPKIRPYYLVLLVLLVVIFSWLAWILWRLLAKE